MLWLLRWVHLEGLRFGWMARLQTPWTVALHGSCSEAHHQPGRSKSLTWQ